MGVFPYKLLNQWIPAFAGMTALEGGLSNDICESLLHTFAGINLAWE